MNAIIFSLFSPSQLSDKVIENCNLEIGDAVLRDFPDGETFIKINSDVQNRDVIVMTSLNYPNNKILPLLFFSRTVKELGAKKIGLIAPYLAYMRQDKNFSTGECISSRYFADLLSQNFDWLLTIDPHLHRYKYLDEVYTTPTFTLHAKEKIVKWIQGNVKNPIIIGPDAESKQWVSSIADSANIPYLILQKIRRGDREVEVSIPQIHEFRFHTVVLIDDIISTGNTMIEAIKHLKKSEVKSVICIGIHALFAKNSYEALKQSGCSIITCNTIDHNTNAIDLSSLIVHVLATLN
ncbi:MAG: ribose-phosphate diphosphokinase [Gammaproteobacteria bacterium]|nr:ribose-phosphate diphosphokinase [Gammaproteobacteria bacterium]